MPKLVVTDLDRTYLVDLPVEESLVIGRSSTCDLRINVPRASRRHCAIESAADGHVLRDLGSTNGTTLGGAPFYDAVAIPDQGVIDIAGCRIVYWARP